MLADFNVVHLQIACPVHCSDDNLEDDARSRPATSHRPHQVVDRQIRICRYGVQTGDGIGRVYVRRSHSNAHGLRRIAKIAHQETRFQRLSHAGAEAHALRNSAPA